MPTIIEREKLDTDPIQLVWHELEAAKKERRPLSRFGLAAKVAEQTGMPEDQAALLVEAFCEQHAAATPAYLRSEFSLFWPKVMAVIFALTGAGIFWLGSYLAHGHRPSWPWLVGGTVVVGLGVFQWVRSLEKYQIYSRQRRMEKTERLREKYAKPR